MIIIVEGIDRVGKTTLCKELFEHTGVKVFRGNDTTDAFKISLKNLDNINETDKILKLIQMCKMFDLDVIFDRSFLSDFVYGTIERKYDLVEANKNFKIIENELLKQKTILILVKPTDLKKSSKEHGKDLSNYEQLFETMFDKSKLNKIYCDYNCFKTVVKFIESEIKNEN